MATFEASTEDALLSDLAEHLERLKEVDSCTQGNPAGDGDASSVHTQLQLPPAVEDLLQKLRSESTDSGLQSLHRRDLQTQGWGSIFGGNRDPDVDGSLSPEQVRKLRLLVIAAAGQCRTLKVINLAERGRCQSGLQISTGESSLEVLHTNTRDSAPSKEFWKIDKVVMWKRVSSRTVGKHVHESLNSVGLQGEARFLIAFMNYIARKGAHPKKFFKRVQLRSTFEPFMEQNAISSLLSATTETLELQCKDRYVTEPDLLSEDDRVPLREQSPKALTLSGFELNEHRVLALATLVRENRVPERLNLHKCSVRDAKFGVFFRALRENTTLRTLDLLGTDGLDDDAFRELLSALEVNSLIHDITGTTWDRVAKIRLRQALE